MADAREETILMCGRDFTQEDLWVVRQTVRIFHRLSRHELAQTVCEHLEWVSPNGRNKLKSCLELFSKLEAAGEIKLPKKQSSQRKAAGEIAITTETDAPSEITGNVASVLAAVKPVLGKDDIRLWNQYVARYHSLGYKQPFGAHQRYFIFAKNGQPLGCLLFAASAWALEMRDHWIDWTYEDRSRRLHLVINNTRFLIFPWVRIKNLASHALSLTTKRIRQDWQERYGYKPVLLETFVDPEKHRGTCYKAANWTFLGETAGRGRMDRYTQHLSSVKHIYAYPLDRDFRSILCGESRDNR